MWSTFRWKPAHWEWAGSTRIFAWIVYGFMAIGALFFRLQ